MTAGGAQANVRDRIVAQRRSRIAAEGHAFGAIVPAERSVPIVPFLREPRLICEIKRRSPSRGAIDASLDPVSLAIAYRDRGVRSVSVLTEEDHFAGSLADLIAIKTACPELSLLRKDFLVDAEDVRVSHRAGADAVLLIASMLDSGTLERMHALATELGMAALVELHEPQDFEKAARFAPPLVGINARDLATFRIDLLTPVRLRQRIDWPCVAVFESGVFTQEDAYLVRTSGFDGLLVGEAAVRDQNAIGGILEGLRGVSPAARSASAPATGAPTGPGFWSALTSRMGKRRPLVKICGITNREDAEFAVELGADLIGFVLAESPRRVTPEFIASLADLPTLKVGVVVTGGDRGALPDDVRRLLEAGFIDAVQYHGDELPEECASQAFPYYKVLRIESLDAVHEIGTYRSPRVLVDARDAKAYGGTGKRLPSEIVRSVGEQYPLWLAGGLSDENIAEVIRDFDPELVDLSSGIEAAPGRKDHERMRRFFRELNHG